MFERYTEQARRVVFFARYEASNYGSRHIETEHLLLGLLRENHALARSFIGPGNLEPEFRAEIERKITRRERFSTAVEVPLSSECKRILNMATEESERLGQRHVGPEHMLLGILREKGSLAAQLLQTRGLRPEGIREQLAKAQGPKYQATAKVGALATLDSFLAGLKCLKSEELTGYFGTDAVFCDSAGRRWNREEIVKDFATLFAPYAEKNSEYVIEQKLAETNDLLAATVLWKNAIVASEQRVWMHRMSFVLLRGEEEWEIILAQVTPVQFA